MIVQPGHEEMLVSTKERPNFASTSQTVEIKQKPTSKWDLTETVEERKQRAFFLCDHKPNPWWKRTIDVIVSVSLLLVLSPLLIGIALFIRLTSGGPVLFRQVRLGEMGKEFVIYKFRTLRNCPNATQNHRQFVNSLTASDSAIAKPDLSKRLISGGNLLRKTSLDELPQLINILKGEMSLIGPRPDVLLWEDYEQYQLQRFEVLPGVTGLWQVSGKNRLTFSEMIDKDLEYVSKRSLTLDLKIALRTIRLLLLRDNA